MGAAVYGTLAAANEAIDGLESAVIGPADRMISWFVDDEGIPQAEWCKKLFDFVGSREDSDIKKLLAFPFYVYYLL